MTTPTIQLDDTTRALEQGVIDGQVLADTPGVDREAWLFFAGRAFALRFGNDQTSPGARAYVTGLNCRKPAEAAQPVEHPEHDCCADSCALDVQHDGACEDDRGRAVCGDAEHDVAGPFDLHPRRAARLGPALG